jgi:hypothetical protein
LFGVFRYAEKPSLPVLRSSRLRAALGKAFPTFSTLAKENWQGAGETARLWSPENGGTTAPGFPHAGAGDG